LFTLMPGAWYLVVTCNQCRSKFNFLHDLSEGKSDLTAGSYFLTCPRCRHQGDYHGKQVERYHHPKEVDAQT
jgi:hypothetical protein